MPQDLTTPQNKRRLASSSAEPQRPKRKHARKGDEGHQEWVLPGFTTDTTRDGDGVVTKIVVTCLICHRQGKQSPFTVKNGALNSPSYTGPRKHLATAHGVNNADQLEDVLGQAWLGAEQTRLRVHGGECSTYRDSWGVRTKEWDRSVDNIAKLVAAADFPFRLGERPEFLRFMRTFLPRWPRISRQTVTRSVKKQSEAIVDSIKGEMLQVHGTGDTDVAMTADMWTSRANDRYMTATLHYLDANWEMHTRVLGEWRRDFEIDSVCPCAKPVAPAVLACHAPGSSHASCITLLCPVAFLRVELAATTHAVHAACAAPAVLACHTPGSSHGTQPQQVMYSAACAHGPRKAVA